MRWITLVLLAAMMAGCAYNGQNFNTDNDSDDTTTLYFDPVKQPDGTWVALIKSHTVATNRVVIHGKNKSTAPPFNSKNNADAHLDMDEGEDIDGNPIWSVQMGQVGEIDGGDIAPVIESIAEGAAAIASGGVSEIIPD